jgi:acyl-coenzyme A thioesterase PaaI-like protein
MSTMCEGSVADGDWVSGSLPSKNLAIRGRRDTSGSVSDTTSTRPEDARFRLPAGIGPLPVDPLGDPFDPIVDTFVKDLFFEFRVNEEGTHGEGRAVITPVMRSTDDFANVAVLSTIADIIGGVPAMHVTFPKLGLTVDMATHLVGGRVEPELSMVSNVIKRGSRIVVTEVRFSNGKSGELVALTQLSFMTSPRPDDVSSPIPYEMATQGGLSVPLGEFVGLRKIRRGIVEIDRRPYVVQPAGNLQGGIVALLGESAAESLGDGAVTDLDVRFLTGLRIGPGRATAESLGHGLVRVEVRDVGEQNRLTAIILARVTSPTLNSS